MLAHGGPALFEVGAATMDDEKDRRDAENLIEAVYLVRALARASAVAVGTTLGVILAGAAAIGWLIFLPMWAYFRVTGDDSPWMLLVLIVWMAVWIVLTIACRKTYLEWLDEREKRDREREWRRRQREKSHGN